jgi:hypothetical protein
LKNNSEKAKKAEAEFIGCREGEVHFAKMIEI